MIYGTLKDKHILYHIEDFKFCLRNVELEELLDTEEQKRVSYLTQVSNLKRGVLASIANLYIINIGLKELPCLHSS